MSGKPRRKKGETLAHYRERVKEWEANKDKPIYVFGEKTTEYVGPEDGPLRRKKPACGNCYYWLPFGNNDQGECFRFPAKVITTSKHWCGEFKGK